MLSTIRTCEISAKVERVIPSEVERSHGGRPVISRSFDCDFARAQDDRAKERQAFKFAEEQLSITNRETR